MNRAGRRGTAIASSALGALVAAFAASALSSQPASADIALDISPMVVELHGAPGTAQHGSVTIRNSGSGVETISLLPIAWSVRDNGDFSIDAVPREPDRNITPYLAVSQQQLQLQPKETRTIVIAATLPTQAGRSYWGGYLVRASDGNGGAFAGATVVVYADAGEVRRHLRVTALDVTPRAACVLAGPPVKVRAPASTASVAPKPCLTATLVNDSDGYCRTGAHLLVAREDGAKRTVVRDEQVTIGVVFPGRTRFLAKPLGDLAPGRYSLRLTADYGADHVIDAEKYFTVR
jgi:hypothetical protein